MLDEFKRLKDEYPDRILIASIMEVIFLRIASLRVKDYSSSAARDMSPRGIGAAARAGCTDMGHSHLLLRVHQHGTGEGPKACLP